MSPLRARKAIKLGPWFRINFTWRSVTRWLRDLADNGHIDTPGNRPWSSVSIGPRGFTWNSRRQTARVALPGPFSYETPRVDPFWTATPEEWQQAIDRTRDRIDDAAAADPERWTDDRGLRWERTVNASGGTTVRYLPDPVPDDEAERQPCPRCGAEPDRPCMTRGGRATRPHMPRVELARTARTYPEPPAADGGVPPWGTPPR